MSTNGRTMNAVAVYCGAAWGGNPAYTGAARQLGAALARRGLTLVYGGGRIGLMGEIADAALHGGGKVAGVITHELKDKELAHHGITDLKIVATMHERKKAMADLADAFVAMPGGVGTLDELFEIVTWAQLGFHAAPIGVLNVGGFYDHLLAFMRHAEREKFLRMDVDRALLVDTDAERLLDRMHEHRPVERRAWDRSGPPA
jgi:uncharacterized protein (TIGR00730 family)